MGFGCNPIPIFNFDMYPSIAEKAAILSWEINAGHVFNDGNKRTSVFTLLIFLKQNNYILLASDSELLLISEHIADCIQNGYSFDKYLEWIKSRIRLAD